MAAKTILSTALLPNIDYIKSILASDIVEIEAYETYRKQSWRNRYEIAGPNGKQALTVPVSKNGETNCPIGRVRVSYDNNWVKNHWKSIETAYNSSPFFLYYKDDFQAVFEKKHELLIEMNAEFLRLVLEILGVDKKINYTEGFKKIYSGDVLDLREKISPKHNNLFVDYRAYYQVFAEKNGFIPNLSVIDLIFNTGPDSFEFIS